MVFLLNPGQKSDCGKYMAALGLIGENCDSLSQLYVTKDDKHILILKVNIPNDLIDKEHVRSTGMSQILSMQTHEERFDNEVSILKSLRHPNIQEIYDICEFNGKRGMLMKIGKVLDRHSKGCVSELSGLESAVYYLRSKRILHKDISPRNILAGKLIDFGLASHIDADNGFFFNRAYCPPEFYEKRAHINSDLYSAALVYFEAMFRQIVFCLDEDPDEDFKEGYKKDSIDYNLNRLRQDMKIKLYTIIKEFVSEYIPQFNDINVVKSIREYPKNFTKFFQDAGGPVGCLSVFEQHFSGAWELSGSAEYKTLHDAMNLKASNLQGVFNLSLDEKFLERFCYYLNRDPEKRIPPKDLLTEELMGYL
ncbi:protein kinase [Candidatus Woesearchaeota archaeon]|nr:protein kinase [Candidatus Woesearchaeota archaeon]